MKILFIASANSVHSLRWIKYFSLNTDNKITWISIKKPNHETLIEFKKLNKNINKYIISNFLNLVSIFKEIMFLRNSLVHIHYLGWHSLLLIFIHKSNKIISTPWGSDLLLNRNKIKNIWLNYLFCRTSLVLCDSKRLANIAFKLGNKKKIINIINFGIDTNLYHKKRDIFSSNKNIVVGSNRRLEKIYDIETFINAAEIVIKNIKNITFQIAGDGSLKDYLNKKVKDKGIENKVRFLGSLDKKEMINFYNSIDIYISTSLSDGGLASSTAEAMSFERLVIVSNNSDNKVWIKDGENGYLFENGNYIQLSKIIESTIKNKASAKEMSKLARETIEKKCSYEKEMSKVNNLYKATMVLK